MKSLSLSSLQLKNKVLSPTEENQLIYELTDGSNMSYIYAYYYMPSEYNPTGNAISLGTHYDYVRDGSIEITAQNRGYDYQYKLSTIKLINQSERYSVEYNSFGKVHSNYGQLDDHSFNFDLLTFDVLI